MALGLPHGGCASNIKFLTSVYYLRHPHGWPEIMSWASRDRHRHRHRDRHRHRAKHLTGPEVSVMFLGVGLEIRLMNGIIISERHSHTLSSNGG